MRSCEDFELLANLVVDEEATLEERSELTRHLETCPDCRAYFEDIRRIHESFAGEAAAPPENFSAQVMARVRAAEQEQPQKKTVPFPRWRRWAALAACCALAAVGVWASGRFGGVRDAMVTADAAPQVAMDAARSMQDAPSVQSAGNDIIESEAAALSDEAPPPMPEDAGKLTEFSKEAGKDEYEPPSAPDAEPMLGASVDPAAAEDANGGETDGTTAPADGAGQDRLDAPAETVSESFPADEEKPAESTEEPAGPLPSPAEIPEDTEGAEGTGEPAEVAPVEVIGVPEPGILIAFGPTARDWVERTLGLEWADGGSYPLTAEQYGDLLRTLELAGESYRVEPGEGYCLMTE